MTALVQRVLSSSVDIDGKRYSETKNGFLVLLGVNENDTEKEADFLCDKLVKLRVFEDENGKMNLSPIKLIEDGKVCEIMVVEFIKLLIVTLNIKVGKHDVPPKDFLGCYALIISLSVKL